MTTTGPPFDKPMPELREAFVRARFAQEDVFGLAGIETWLQWERAQERPNEVSWKSFLARDFTKMCAATMPLLHLQDRATRYTPFQRGTERSTAPFGRILPLFKDGFYWGYRDVGVYVHEPMKELFVLSETHGKLTIERIGDANIYVGAKAVVDVLFAEWDRQRPKWEQAREFLCNALAEEVKRERAKAEADFDTAVAVSADGTKIVHADWVLVFGQAENGSQDLRVAASAFRDRKILLTGPCTGCQGQMKMRPERNGPDGADWNVERFFRNAHAGTDAAWGGGYGYGYRSMTAHTRAWPPEQKLLCLKDGRILFVHHDQCPDPLPEDDAHVRV